MLANHIHILEGERLQGFCFTLKKVIVRSLFLLPSFSAASYIQVKGHLKKNEAHSARRKKE